MFYRAYRDRGLLGVYNDSIGFKEGVQRVHSLYRRLLKVKEFGFGGVRMTEKLVEKNIDMKWKLGLCGGLWGSGYVGRYRKTELFWQFPTH